jgi:hypothetical protein
MGLDMQTAVFRHVGYGGSVMLACLYDVYYVCYDDLYDVYYAGYDVTCTTYIMYAMPVGMYVDTYIK